MSEGRLTDERLIAREQDRALLAGEGEAVERRRPGARVNPRDLRPTRHMRGMSRRWNKGIWKVLWKMREEGRGQVFADWPDWCFLPSGITREVARRSPVKPPPGHSDVDAADTDAPLLGALAAWRATQGVYRFDPDLFAAVWETPLSGKIPVAALQRMPEWCVYAETPSVSWPYWGSLAGFFAYLDAPDRSLPMRLWVILDFEEQPEVLTLVPFFVPLDAPTVEEAVSRMRANAERAGATDAEMERRALRSPSPHGRPLESEAETRAESVAELRALVGRLAHPLSVLLYLCSETAEYADARGSGRSPGPPEPKKTKKGSRIFPPDRPTVWETGYRMGAALRTVRGAADDGEETGRGSSPRPHVRRAHWHKYWTGPKNRPEERECVPRWLPPIPVKLDDPEDLVPVVRPVD